MKINLIKLRNLLIGNRARRDDPQDSKLEIINTNYGFSLSKMRRRPCAENGNPIPWYTYSCLEYISQFDFIDCNVFEYGSGNSTLFWSKRAKSIQSVEHDVNWHKSWDGKLPSNATVVLKKTKDEYINHIENAGISYDIIIVDGIYRVSCCKKAIKRINKGGLVILDNSDWHPTAAKILRDSGLLQVDMFGFGPLNDYTWVTSIFFSRDFQRPTTNSNQPCFAKGGLNHEDTIE